jgi:hypothetical protein
MDPQLDVNILIQLLNGVGEFVAFARAQHAVGLTYNNAVRQEFLANGLGSQTDLISLEQDHGITLLSGISDQEMDAAGGRLQAAFVGDVQGRTLRLQDARVLATAFLRKEALATADLQLFKRARDLGLAVLFVGAGRAAARAAAYVPRPVMIPGSP